jgi:hypothetical protein
MIDSGVDAPIVRVSHILTRREVSASYLVDGGWRAVIVWQTRLDDGGWRINGMTVGEGYYRPNRDGIWPGIVPAGLIVWAKGLE